MMDAQIYARVREAYMQALELPEASREAAIARVCRSEVEVAEVKALLAETEQASIELKVDTQTAHKPDPLNLVGQTINHRYEIVGFAAEGGFSHVYQARHVLWDRPLAIKFFKPVGSAEQQQEFRASFIKEGALLNELARSNLSVVQSYDIDEWQIPDGTTILFTVLEWLEGENLAEMLKLERENACTTGWGIKPTVQLLEPIASALAMVHARGVAHRDIKPSNILISRTPTGERQPKLLDFGIAKDVSGLTGGFDITQGHTSVFTLRYGAPEQINRELGSTGPWTDVYALALICVELLVGHHPIPETDISVFMRRVLDTRRRPTPRCCGVEVGDPVEEAFQRALAVDPRQRPTDAGAFWLELTAALDRQDSLSEPPPIVVQAENEQRFGHYRLLEKIGAGGMGIVHRGFDERLGREVAVKILAANSASDEQVRNRFLLEARAIAKLDHANVCAIYDVGETPLRRPYFVMPYYEGETLRDVVRRGALAAHRAIDCLIQVCRGVEAVHQHNIIHRDIKPTNVLITKSGVVKLLDFGVAKTNEAELTLSGQVLGTICYMAPEQLTGESVSEQTDLWSIGALFYELMTGHRPFRGDSHLEISCAILRCQPDPLTKFFPQPPALLEKIIARTLSISPTSRYSDVGALRHDLELLREDLDDLDQTRLPTQEANANDGPSAASSVLTGPLEQQGASIRRTLDAIYTEFSGFAGPTARLVFNAHSHRAQSLVELCQTLEQELEQPAHRQAFSLAVSKLVARALSVPPPKAAHPASPAPERRDSRMALALLIPLALGVGYYGAKATGNQASETTQHPIDPHIDVRGVTKDQVTLGMTGAFSGSIKETGRAMHAGMASRFHEINEAGGIHGRRIELRAVDDAYKPKRAQKNIQKLLAPNDGVFALIGNTGTPTTKAVLPEILRQKTVLFGVISGAKLLRENPPDRYVFNYRASYAEETAALVHHFVEEGIAPARIGVLYQDDSYGTDGLAGVEQALKALGTRGPPIRAGYPGDSAKVDAASKQMLMHRDALDAIIIVGSYQASATFTKLMKDGGYQGQFANTSPVGPEVMAEEFALLGSHYADGVIVAEVVPHYDAHATGVEGYRTALKKHFPNQPYGSASLEGYIVASIFAEGLERAGRALNTDSLIDALHSIEDLDLGIGPSISFRPSQHQASHFVWAARLTGQGTIEQLELRRN